MSEINLGPIPDSSGSDDPVPSSHHADRPVKYSTDDACLLKAIENPANTENMLHTVQDHPVHDSTEEERIRVLPPGDDHSPGAKGFKFNSLPRELRDQIRHATVYLIRGDPKTTAMHVAYLACVDSEWRDDIETVTFQTLGEKYSVPAQFPPFSKRDIYTHRQKGFGPADLPDFERYLVGNRRRHLKLLNLRHICDKPAHGMSGLEVNADQQSSKVVSVLQDLFTILNKWEGAYTDDGSPSVNVKVEIVRTWLDRSKRGPDLGRAVMAKLEETPIVTVVTVPLVLQVWHPESGEDHPVHVVGTRSTISLHSR